MSTPLDDYMQRNGIKDAEFAPLIKLDRSMVSKIRRGIIKPTLDTAAEIEVQTSGEVPMQAWTPLAESPPPFQNPTRRTVDRHPAEAHP
ncbi:MAG TPA: helix-turn-helix transcriptional regulator [Sphingomonas sp.]|nr:helix-turn-helix transcriptional regulator [Sphingomonas sp.]